MRRVLRHAQARTDLSHEVPDTRCGKSGCVRIHRAVPQPEDAAKDRQAGFEVLHPFTTVRGVGVEPEDQDILGEAEEFLKQVAEGAAFISTGTHSRGSVINSTYVFGFALHPIESLDLLKDRQAPEVFDGLAKAVHEIAAGQASTLNEADIVNARAFFDRLYASILELIESNRLRPTAVGRSALLGQLI